MADATIRVLFGQSEMIESSEQDLFGGDVVGRGQAGSPGSDVALPYSGLRTILAFAVLVAIASAAPDVAPGPGSCLCHRLQS
jgi:hypothetical protein